jgi:hypothetical protein
VEFDRRSPPLKLHKSHRQGRSVDGIGAGDDQRIGLRAGQDVFKPDGQRGYGVAAEVHYLIAAIALSEGEWPRPLYPDWMSNLGRA